MKDQVIARRTLLTMGGATAATMLCSTPARAESCGGLTREEFERYIAIFSENDRDDYADFYTPDVLYERGDRHVMRGIESIVAFYRELHRHLSHKLRVVNFASAGDFVAAEVHSEFTVFKDYQHESGLDFKAGDHFIGHNFVHYELRDGRICHIKSTRFKRIA